MTGPALTAQRFAAAFLIGIVLGFVYSFLRPLRPRFTLLSDLLFLGAVFFGWLQLAFRVCGGDMRIAYLGGMGLGTVCWEQTAGRLLRPMFGIFWQSLGDILRFFLNPVKKISKKLKILFASGEKWVTIKWNNRRQTRRTFGGKKHGKNQRIFQSDSADLPAQQQRHQDRGDRRYRIVYGNSDRPAHRDE